MAKSYRVILKEVMCNWPTLYVAEEYMGKKRYSVQLHFEPDSDNHKALLKAIEEAVESAHPGKSEAMLKRFKGSRTTWPIRELDDGGLTVTPKRNEDKGAPLVLDQKKQVIPADRGLPYAGCIVNCSLDVFCYAPNGGGVTTYLNGIQLVKEGTPLGGAPTVGSTMSDFDDISTDSSDEDLF